MSLKLLFIAFLWLYIFVGVHVFSSASLSMITVWTFCLASLSVVGLKLLH